MVQKTESKERTRTQDLLVRAKNALKRNSRMVLIATALFAGAIIAPKSCCQDKEPMVETIQCGDKKCHPSEKYALVDKEIDDKLFCKEDCCPNMDDGKCTPEDTDKCSPCYSPNDCKPVCNNDKVCDTKETVKGCSDCVDCNGKKISKKDTECKPGERFDKKSCICKAKAQAVVVQGPICGDGKCESPETINTCVEDCGHKCGSKRIAYTPECQPNSPTLVNGGCEDGKKCTSACRCKEEKKPDACSNPTQRKCIDNPDLCSAIRFGISKVSTQTEFNGQAISPIQGNKVGAKVTRCVSGAVKVEVSGDLDALQKKMVASSISRYARAVRVNDDIYMILPPTMLR